MPPSISVPSTLLVPVDLSPRSAEAVAYAVELARELDARIALTINLNLPERACLEDRQPDWSGSMEELAEVEVSRWALVESGQAPVDVIVTNHPEPADGILAAVAESGADALVIGSHGRSMASRWILGSVTERVIRDSTVPVFVVPSHVTIPATSGRAI